MAISRRGLAAGVLLVFGGVLLAAPAPVRPPKPDEKLLAEVSVPPPGFAPPNKPSALKIDLGKTSVIAYADAGEAQPKFRDAVREAQLFLWATSPALPPAALRADVQALRQRVAFSLRPRELWIIPKTPPAEKAFQAAVYRDSRDQARLMFQIERHLQALDDVAELRGKECKRWRANYDLMRAWLLLRVIHVEEVSMALGQLRKELPPHDAAKDKAFALRAHDLLKDGTARKMARQAEKALDAIMEDYPDTVWADLASRNRVRSLGVEWATTR